MCILLYGSIDRLSLKVLKGVTKILRHEVLLLTILQVMVKSLQLIHKIINHYPSCYFYLLAICGHVSAQDHMLELVDHEELLKDGVNVANRSEVFEAHVHLADLALL